MRTLKKNIAQPQPSQSVEQKTLLEQQLAELMRVGVGGKFKQNNTEDYTKKITEELELLNRQAVANELFEGSTWPGSTYQKSAKKIEAPGPRGFGDIGT